MFPKKIGFIGLGHIGGSVAKTIHRFYPEIEMIAFDTSAEALSAALDDGILTAACKDLTDDFCDCDYIWLCAPVLNNDDYIPRLLDLIGENTILTDVGSVKTRIHQQVERYPALNAHFIGGHPMCGTEHTGYRYSTPNMLENAYYMLTPSAAVPDQAVLDLKNFIASIGAIPIVIDYRKHDRSVGFVSHLPHMISATLVNLVKKSDDEQETLRTIAAGGFRDITRISSSSPIMWENISIANREEILYLLDTYIAALQDTRGRIDESDPAALTAFFQSAKDYRDSFNISRGAAFQPVYELFCYIDDAPGTLNNVTTILASSQIGIKNSSIVHNREYEEGVLQLEFYTRHDYDLALAQLKKYDYTVYERK